MNYSIRNLEWKRQPATSNADETAEPTYRAMDRPRRILVDVSVILKHDARTGIQRVVRAIWLNLRQRGFSQWTVRPVFATPQHAYCYAPEDFLDCPDDVASDAHIPLELGPGDIFLGLDLAAHILPRHERQIREWRDRGATIHLLVYDLLPITGGQWFNWRTQRNFCRWLAFILRQADQAICISDHVAGELRQWMEARDSKRAKSLRVSRIRLGSDIASTVPTQAMASSEEGCPAQLYEQPFILMVGTVEPRKGYASALKAFDLIWRDPLSGAPALVIAGKPGWKTWLLQKRLKRHREAGRRLFWLESASDELLESLYSACTGVLMTSHAEGFGLPVIEALSHGKPVLLRDIPVFREFGNNGVSYFSDDRPRPLAARILDWLGSAHRVNEAARWNAPPTWADATDDLIAAINSVLTEARGRPAA